VLIVADAADEGARAAIAEGLANQGFSAIEPVSSKTLMAAAKAIQHLAYLFVPLGLPAT
jgi:hypothetical protein